VHISIIRGKGKDISLWGLQVNCFIHRALAATAVASNIIWDRILDQVEGSVSS